MVLAVSLWSMILWSNYGTEHAYSQERLVQIDFDDIDEEKQEEVAAEMLVRDTVVALAADPKSCEPLVLVTLS